MEGLPLTPVCAILAVGCRQKRSSWWHEVFWRTTTVVYTIPNLQWGLCVNATAFANIWAFQSIVGIGHSQVPTKIFDTSDLCHVCCERWMFNLKYGAVQLQGTRAQGQKRKENWQITSGCHYTAWKLSTGQRAQQGKTKWFDCFQVNSVCVISNHYEHILYIELSKRTPFDWNKGLSPKERMDK